MSTLEYLDEKGSVTNFSLVPAKLLHRWLSCLNGNPSIDITLAKGVNRGKVLEELEARRKGKEPIMMGMALRMVGRDREDGKDWREYENDAGFTHFEELLIFQPRDWRKQAREYLFRYKFDLNRISSNELRTVSKDLHGKDISLELRTPILVVLFHPFIKQTFRYEPMNFLLAYGVPDPFPKLTKSMDESTRSLLMEEISPLDYFISFQNHVSGYNINVLRKIGKENAFPRLPLIKELDFSDIIGQRLAKQMIRSAMVNHIWNRDPKQVALCNNRQPLSMIFAGPSGNGKTELAMWLSKLMNKPQDDCFIKIDCGKMTHASEIFGLSGAYQGAHEGSALNNFVLRMSLEPDALGIVLLDEIEKAGADVIHGLYQVIDKGEWTNKQLRAGKGTQTETIPCHNLVFILTTNACDDEIQEFAFTHNNIYTTVGDEFQELGEDLADRLRKRLTCTYPFTKAFIGRVGRIIPFLPMANGDPEREHPLLGEMMTVAKLLIERQQEKYASGTTTNVHQLISTKTKHRMAKIVVKDTIPEAGVRSIQKGVEAKMGDRMMHALCLEEGGISHDSTITYFAKEDEKKIDFRLLESKDIDQMNDDADTAEGEEEEDLYG
jgi:MoxR-like ATPase